jgi:acetoin utilization deacetylase AcuC-like enzyme
MRVAHGSRGFCNINIEAVMIEFLRRKYDVDRVAIVDTDCHHGDGTQDIYWHDPDTLFISLHQDGRTLYPGSGFPAELGGPNAVGYTLNLPLPPHTTEEGFLHVIRAPSDRSWTISSRSSSSTLPARTITTRTPSPT